ncbi:epigen-like [Antennarius striatus]|uniref:epigen-like n=1 Tax=Antennarius striatus TaxID=241820 RepID=UPI0035AF65ED
MLTQRQKRLENLLSAVLLLTAAGLSPTLADNLQTTAAPESHFNTSQTVSRNVEKPVVLRSHTTCGSEHANYCENGGQCMYPQDSDKPFCICTSSYSGARCHFFSISETRSPAELEKLIAIGFGVVMFLFFLAFMIYCFANKRCTKSTLLIKSAPSESLV